jgi:acetyl-CoA carboxylase carboxyl transferase subunit alpha
LTHPRSACGASPSRGRRQRTGKAGSPAAHEWAVQHAAGPARAVPAGRETENKENTLAKKTFLDFEQPIAELETKIEELRYVQTESAVDISEEIDQLSKKSQQLTKDIYSVLTPWQITKIARHPERPYTLDYVGEIFTNFIELHGDRHFADDLSIVGGLARFNGNACMVIGQQKGRDTKERGLRNFGMSRPEGYRKALRLMKTAEKFKLPVFTFVDTPGAYPGIDAEERGQSEAIGRNIFEMCQLEVPIITTVIGEGGSGGALAISVADQVLMLQYSIYSVISPEGCASILWKTSEKAQDAADAMGITAHRLKALGLIDKIVNEPVGGAHRDHRQMAAFLKRALNEAWRQLSDLKVRELLERRYERLQSYGRFTDTKADAR